MFPSLLRSMSARISSSSPFFSFSPRRVFMPSFSSSMVIFPSPSQSNLSYHVQDQQLRELQVKLGRCRRGSAGKVKRSKLLLCCEDHLKDRRITIPRQLTVLSCWGLFSSERWSLHKGFSKSEPSNAAMWISDTHFHYANRWFGRIDEYTWTI